MAEDHDKSYRLLFSFPRMVEDLVHLFVGGTWTQRLDFESLEKVSERDVSKELLRREKDLLWRLRLFPSVERNETTDWLHLYCHLEFQSVPDPFMALRVFTYRALLWEDLLRRGALTASGKLPPVLSIVLYNGTKPWRGSTSLPDLIESPTNAPEGVDLTRFRLIDERQIPRSTLIPEASPVMGLFRMEQSHDPEDLIREARKTVRGLATPEDARLREALGTWLSATALPRLTRDLEFPLKLDLMEIPSMLEERVIEWTEQWKQEGLQEGLLEGRKEGETSFLLRLLNRKYGPVPAWALKRLDAATAEQILNWGERVLTAPTLEQVFAD